jgi:hypothetical protein
MILNYIFCMPINVIELINNFQNRQPTISEDDVLMYRRPKYFRRYIQDECPAALVQFIRTIIRNHGLENDVIEKMNFMIEENIMSDYVLPHNQDRVNIQLGGYDYVHVSYAINIFHINNEFWVNMTTEQTIKPAFRWYVQQH